MPYEEDRLRMQRESDGTYSVELPDIWCRTGYVSALSAMNATAEMITERSKGTDEQERLLSDLSGEEMELRKKLAATKIRIAALNEEMDTVSFESAAIIDGGYDAVALFEIENRYTRKHGAPRNVFVTPWDKDRDGEVELGEFEVCYGWSRYKMVEEG